MKLLSSKLEDAILYTATAVCGLVFVFAVWVMANDYKPFVSDRAIGQALNAALIDNFSAAMHAACFQMPDIADVPSGEQLQTASRIETGPNQEPCNLFQLGASLLLPSNTNN